MNECRSATFLLNELTCCARKKLLRPYYKGLHFGITYIHHIYIPCAFFFTRHLRLKHEPSSYFVEGIWKRSEFLGWGRVTFHHPEAPFLLKYPLEHQNYCPRVYIHPRNIKYCFSWLVPVSPSYLPSNQTSVSQTSRKQHHCWSPLKGCLPRRRSGTHVRVTRAALSSGLCRSRPSMLWGKAWWVRLAAGGEAKAEWHLLESFHYWNSTGSHAISVFKKSILILLFGSKYSDLPTNLGLWHPRDGWPRGKVGSLTVWSPVRQWASVGSRFLWTRRSVPL